MVKDEIAGWLHEVELTPAQNGSTPLWLLRTSTPLLLWLQPCPTSYCSPTECQHQMHITR